jgi:hypothetical protein
MNRSRVGIESAFASLTIFSSCDVALAPLYPANIIAMNPGALRQFFLRKSTVIAKAPYS